MLRALVVFAAAGCLLRANAQPAACESDRQCQSGFYCVPNVFLCRRCLVCEDLKRDPPPVPTSCIKSVAECGSCFEGLVDDLGGDVSAGCVAREATGGGGGGSLPAWAWAAVSLGLLLFVLVLVAVLYVLRHTNTFKILASTRTSVRSPAAAASAPDAPPPYRAHYHHNHHHHHHDRDDRYDTDVGLDRDHRDLLTDEADPTAPSEAESPPAPRAAGKPRAPPAGPREAAASQATRYYSAPYYVRPPTYSEAGAAPAPPPAPPPHDEDTMESDWTPAANHQGTDDSAPAGELAELLAAARLTHYHRQPAAPQHHHPHHPCVQDSNNNRGSGSAPAGSTPRPASSPAPPVSYIINVVQNMQNRA